MTALLTIDELEIGLFLEGKLFNPFSRNAGYEQLSNFLGKHQGYRRFDIDKLK